MPTACNRSRPFFRGHAAAAALVLASCIAGRVAGQTCPLIIPGGAQSEVESPFNCADGPDSIQTVLCGVPFHGTACFNAATGFRDTDWVKVILTEPGTVTAVIRTESAGMMGFVGTGEPQPVGPDLCQQLSQISPFVSTAEDCQPRQITATLPAGTYVLLIAPSFGASNWGAGGLPARGDIHRRLRRRPATATAPRTTLRSPAIRRSTATRRRPQAGRSARGALTGRWMSASASATGTATGRSTRRTSASS